MKISVWDDAEDVSQDWKEKLDVLLVGEGVDVNACSRPEIEEDLGVLHERRRRLLGDSGVALNDGQCNLDVTDVLIVDNDLFELAGMNDLSAETVASRAGVYSDCGCIVVVNLNRDVDFDLSMLGTPESKADLHINDQFVADNGLWLECPRNDGEFRPWHWPLLLSTAVLYRWRIEQIAEALESGKGKMPILDYFGFGVDSRRSLSRSARAFLHPTEKDVDKVSFLDFVGESVKAVSPKDGERIREREERKLIARIAARRLAKWLEWHVLGPQDVLTDLPHLVERMPFMVPADERECQRSWNRFAKLTETPLGLTETPLGLTETPLGLTEEFGVKRFEMAKWFDRPVFWVESIETEENRERFLREDDANPLGLVFCEDSSSFHVGEQCEGFVAAHNSLSARRFVRWLNEHGEGVRYGPLSRLAI